MSSTSPTASISGLGSGLDVDTIVSQLMSLEKSQQSALSAKKTESVARQAAWGSIGDKLSSLQTAATALSDTSNFKVFSASTTNSSLLTATTSTTAQPATVTMTVNKLARAQQLASADFGSGTSVVGAGTMTLAAGAGALGFTGVRAVAGTATGAHQLTVGKLAASATAGAASSLTFAQAASFSVTLADGTTKTATIAAGTTYSSADNLVSALNQQLGTAAAVTQKNGVLSLATTATGSAATLSLTASAGFGFGANPVTATGADVGITVDGTSRALTNADYNTTVTVGALSLDVGASLKAGSSGVAVATTAAGATLNDLVTQIGKSGSVASAGVVDTGSATDGVQLVLSARGTGTAGAMLVDTGGLAGFGAGLRTITASQDAEIQMGTMTVTRSTNTFTDVMPGVTLNLVKADPTTPVTVSVAQDNSAVLSKAQALVSAVNGVLSTVSDLTKYDVQNSAGSPLTGDSVASGISSQVYDIMSSMFSGGGSSTKVLAQIGITAQRDGTYAIDTDAFTKALNDNPDGVAALVADRATALKTYTTKATQTGGTIASVKSSEVNQQSELQTQIDDWDERLAQIEQRYREQFTALDTAMAQMKDQSSWLSSTISSLPSWG